MKSKAILAASIVFAFSASLYPQTTGSQQAKNEQSTDPIPAQAQTLAEHMVPAQAVLDSSIDARDMHQGQQIRATLSESVRLKNGTELPRGTAIIGTIAADKMQSGGPSTLALRFTQADPKNGKAVPISATIIGITGPEYGADWSNGSSTPAPTAWDGKALRIDETGAVRGFDLHSRIAGDNSAVFTSQNKDNVKLPTKTQMSLAIGPAAAQTTNGGAL